tara:strand:- start:56 stop:619 length:564 start_codon:yes stop_codon:yes gene_type:complete
MGIDMPLSTAASRKLIHTRDIRCHGYERDDGLWDIEGQITDTKSYSFDNQERGRVGAGMPVHNMLVRLTVDDELVVQKAEAGTESAPFGVCLEISANVRRLEGVKISSGWTKAVRDKFGGTAGCTHILQLIIGPLATTAYQTIMPLKNSQNKGRKPTKKPAIINTCHAFAAEGPIVKRLWPEYSDAE